ncbi:Periplasmic protein TonB (fragment) [Candidatus Terasakiella magnetica]
MRLAGTILWSSLAACVGVGLFFVKHEVKDLEHRLSGLNTEIARNQESIHVLRAEWSYLNDPIRLRALSEKHLGMHPVTPAQVTTLNNLPKDGIPTIGPVYAAISPARIAGAIPPAMVPAPEAGTSKLAENHPLPRPAAPPARGGRNGAASPASSLAQSDAGIGGGAR